MICLTVPNFFFYSFVFFLIEDRATYILHSRGTAWRCRGKAEHQLPDGCECWQCMPKTPSHTVFPTSWLPLCYLRWNMVMLNKLEKPSTLSAWVLAHPGFFISTVMQKICTSWKVIQRRHIRRFTVWMDGTHIMLHMHRLLKICSIIENNKKMKLNTSMLIMLNI